jgi:hypothetical protein
MSGHKARIRTIQVLLAGSAPISTSPVGAMVQSEFGEVHAVRKVRMSSRRRLLEVLHSSRALDTALKAFVSHHRCSGPKIKKAPTGLGSCLFILSNHATPGLGNLTATQRALFQSNIVGKRNLYLHEAGAFPSTDSEVNVLLADMDVCLATIVAL